MHWCNCLFSMLHSLGAWRAWPSKMGFQTESSSDSMKDTHYTMKFPDLFFQFHISKMKLSHFTAEIPIVSHCIQLLLTVSCLHNIKGTFQNQWIKLQNKHHWQKHDRLISLYVLLFLDFFVFLIFTPSQTNFLYHIFNLPCVCFYIPLDCTQRQI